MLLLQAVPSAPMAPLVSLPFVVQLTPTHPSASLEKSEVPRESVLWAVLSKSVPWVRCICMQCVSPSWPINSHVHVLTLAHFMGRDSVKNNGIEEGALTQGKKPKSSSQLCYKLCVTLGKLISSLWGCVQWGRYGGPCHPDIHFLKHSSIHSLMVFIHSVSHLSWKLRKPVLWVRMPGNQNKIKSTLGKTDTQRLVYN